MKKLLLIFVLSLSGYGQILAPIMQGVTAASCTGTPTNTGTASCSFSSTSGTCTFSSASAGDLIVACGVALGTSSNGMTISDDKNGAYTATHAAVVNPTTTSEIKCFYFKNSTASAGTVTVTLSDGSNNAYHELHIDKYSGAATSSVLGNVVTATNGGSTNATTGSFAVANGSLITGFVYATAVTAGAGPPTFTLRAQQATAVGYEDGVISGTSATANFVHASVNWAIIGQEFFCKP